MKKILFAILAAAAMSAACTQFAEDLTPTYDAVGKPEVVADVADDDSITVVITAGENTSYYGYAVVKDTLVGVTAEKLVADGYAKDPAVVLQGEEQAPQTASIKYSEETKTVTLQLTGLVPFTDYTVYAAAISPMGVPSEVVAVTVRTTDGTEPVVDAESAKAEEADSVLTFAIPFSDPIALTGEGTAKAYIYAENYVDENGLLVVYKEVEIPADHMATDGKNLLLSVPLEEYIPGACVSMTYSADIVVNGAGKKNVAFEDHLMAWMEGELVWNGIVGFYDYVNWDFSLVDPATLPDDPEGEDEMEGEDEEEEEKIPVYFNDWTQLVMPNYTTSEFTLYGPTGDVDIKITTVEASGKSITYPAKNYEVTPENIFALMLSEAPAYGSTVSYTIAEGSVADLFGNVNSEFTAEEEYYYSYGYTQDEIYGSYTFNATSALDGSTVTKSMVIEESDDPEEGDFMITSFAGIPCVKPVYGYFNPDSGSVDIYGEQPFYGYVDDNDTPDDTTDDVAVTYIFYTYSFTWLNMTMTQSGVISGPDGMFGVAIANDGELSSWGYLFEDFVAQKVEEEVPAPTPAVAKALNSNKYTFTKVEKR